MWKPVIFIPVALPGAGKSTWATGLPPEVVVHSTDNVRTKLKKDPGSVDQSIFDTYHAWIDFSLSNRESVYADATNLRDYARAELLSIARRHKATTHLILFRNVRQAIERNAARTGTTPGTMPVPADVMHSMIEQYERAVIDIWSERYDFITEIKAVR